MASNDYYNSYNQQPPHPHPQQPEPYHSGYSSPSSQTPQPYSNAYNPQQPPIPTPPPYRSEAPSLAPTRTPSRLTDISPVSPYEGQPFQDHVYPGSDPGRHQSQNSLGQDSQYYGPVGGGRAQDSTNSFRDDIPLRDQTPGKAGNDHVYDAPPNDHVYDAEPGRKQQSGPMGFLKNPKRIAWVTYTFTLVQVCVFIAEIVKNAKLTGSPIEIHPSFNPMIGPSTYVLINMGARFVPCMHNVVGIETRTSPVSWPCPNTTDSSVEECSLSQLCGFKPFNVSYTGSIDAKPEPDQWFRFILPMFLHAGIIHIGFNMLLQLTMGKEMEMIIGPIRYFIVYVCAGIFGFVLGGNFAATGIASTGASGALFGILALTLLDLLYHWNERVGPWKEFAFIMLDVIISFVLGLLPGLDNFSHIGGFLMGLVLGLSILRSPASLRQRIGEAPPYRPVSQYRDSSNGEETGFTSFVKNPVGFFKGRKGAWWAWWILRVLALAGVLAVFIVLLNNFYIYRKTCSWCKYLSCLPVNNWCNIGNLDLTDSNTTSKRSLLDSWDAMAKLYD